MGKMGPVVLTRRFSSFLWLAVLVVIAIAFYGLQGSGSEGSGSWRSPFTTDDGLLSYFGYASKPGEPTRIALLESAGVHDEVEAALVHAFGGQKNAELSIYLRGQRFNMGDIIANFSLEAPIVAQRTADEFNDDMYHGRPPHVLVSTTCELDLEPDNIVNPIRHLLSNTTTHLFCLVHHADRWVEGRHSKVAQEWVEQERVDFIGLSNHTVDFFLNQTVPQWPTNKTVTMRTFPPVFPVEHADADAAAPLSLAMQGDYSSGRRDYQGIFEHLGGVIRKVKTQTYATDEATVDLHVIGHGHPPEVPENVRDHVIFDQGPSYPDFYALLSQAFSILPAFASDEYFDRKASSTVPASLIAGAPLVASEELLAAYAYLPRDAAWVAQPGETEMGTIYRVIEDRDEYLRKRDVVRQACKDLAQANRVQVGDWISEVMAKAEAPVI